MDGDDLGSGLGGEEDGDPIVLIRTRPWSGRVPPRGSIQYAKAALGNVSTSPAALTVRVALGETRRTKR